MFPKLNWVVVVEVVVSAPFRNIAVMHLVRDHMIQVTPPYHSTSYMLVATTATDLCLYVVRVTSCIMNDLDLGIASDKIVNL